MLSGSAFCGALRAGGRKCYCYCRGPCQAQTPASHAGSNGGCFHFGAVMGPRCEVAEACPERLCRLLGCEPKAQRKIPFSPNWLTDQRFLETVTILQNPVLPQEPSVEHEGNHPAEALPGAEAAAPVGRGVVSGKGQGRRP